MKRNFNFKPFETAYFNTFEQQPPCDSAWLTWFVGFCEGEGSFTIAKRGEGAFVISQSLLNVNVLFEIQKNLNFGRVTWQNKKNRSVRWIVQDFKTLEVLIILFNGNLTLPKRRQDLRRFIESQNAFKTKPRKRKTFVGSPLEFLPFGPTPMVYDGWLSGFSDAEGCFHARLRQKNYRFEFSLSQNGKSALAVLNLLPVFFGGGTVQPHSQPGAYTYYTTGLAPCVKVQRYFLRFPLKTTKLLSFERWCELLQALLRKDHLNPGLRPVLKLLAESINVMTPVPHLGWDLKRYIK